MPKKPSAKAPKEPNVDLSKDNWPNLLSLNLNSRVPYADLTQVKSHKRRKKPNTDPWFDYRNHYDYFKEYLDETIPTLIATGFFHKTKFEQLQIEIYFDQICNRRGNAALSNKRKSLAARQIAHSEDYSYLKPQHFNQFKIGMTAEIILQICNELKLDRGPAEKLKEKYPIFPNDLSPIYSGPCISLKEPHKPDWFTPLTNKELSFWGRDSSQWIIKGPYPESIAKIDHQTLTIEIDTDEDEDLIAEIANAALQAPAAVIHLKCGRSPLHYDGLAIFKNIRRLSLSSYYSMGPLEKLPSNIIYLELSGNFDLKGLHHLNNLECLEINDHAQALDIPQNLATLRAISLHQCTLQSLEPLAHLHNLQSFGLFSCKVKDLSALAKLDQLKYLGLTANPDFTDLDVIHNMPKLELLSLASLKNLQKMPLMRNCINLRRVSITGCQNLTDLNGLAAAPNLQELIIFNMDHLTPEHVSAFKGLKSLKAVRTDNLAIEKYLGIPRGLSSRPFQFSEYVPMSAQDIAARKQSLAGEQPTLPDTLTEALGEIREVPSNQELAVNIRLTAEWGSDAEIVALNDLGDEWEEILLDMDLGAWDGQEIGGGYRTIFYVGPDAKAMYDALKEELSVLPAGSFVEFKDADRETIKTIHLGGK